MTKAQIVAERRSRPEVRRRFCLEPLAAARAHAAKQCHASHLGLIGGISIGRSSRKRTEPSAKRRRHSPGSARRATRAATSDGMHRPMRTRVRLGFRLRRGGRRWLLSFDGGRLELSRVFGGSPSLASNSATRAVSASICFVRPATTRSCASAAPTPVGSGSPCPALQGLRDSSQGQIKPGVPCQIQPNAWLPAQAHPTSSAITIIGATSME